MGGERASEDERLMPETVRPEWENDVEFANRRKTRATYVARPTSYRVSETVIRDSRRPSAQYIPAPQRASTPIIKHVSPERPRVSHQRIELVSVEQMRSDSPRTSKVSVSNKGKSRRGGSRGDIEEVVERERIRERLPPQEEYETFRYVDGAPREERADRRRSRSITYETNPRLSGRVVERERVVVEDGGRRREYYRRP